jgi:hypothetical protein
MPKLSVSDIVLAMLKSKEWVGADEFERRFPEKVEGHRSWNQRLRGLRELRNGGHTIIYRTKAGTKHLTEWHLEQANVSTIAQISPKEAQGCVDTPELGKDDFQAPKPTEGLETQNSSPVYFEKEGQLLFLR